MADFLKHGVSHIQLSPGSLMMPDFSSARFYTPEELGWQLDNGKEEETPQDDNNTIFIDPNLTPIAITSQLGKAMFARRAVEGSDIARWSRNFNWTWIMMESNTSLEFPGQYEIFGGILLLDSEQQINFHIETSQYQELVPARDIQDMVYHYQKDKFYVEYNNRIIILGYDFDDIDDHQAFQFQWFREDKPEIVQNKFEVYHIQK